MMLGHAPAPGTAEDAEAPGTAGGELGGSGDARGPVAGRSDDTVRGAIE